MLTWRRGLTGQRLGSLGYREIWLDKPPSGSSNRRLVKKLAIRALRHAGARHIREHQKD
jgi:hypothetical protein